MDPVASYLSCRTLISPHASIKQGDPWDPFCFPLFWLTSWIRYLQFLELCSLSNIWIVAPSLKPTSKMTKNARYDHNIFNTSSALFLLVVNILGQ